MKSTMTMLLGAGLFAVGSGAQAADVNFSARLGVTEGGYQNKSTLGITDGASGASQATLPEKSWFLASGVQAGASAAYGDVFADLAIEYLGVFSKSSTPGVDDPELDRTDVLATVGYLVDDHWSVYAGYRRGMQGSGLFDDDTFSENGGFVGVGFGGVEVGPLMLGSSLAYNFSKAKDFAPDGSKFDYKGVSFKVDLRPKAAPQHSLQIRYQRFNGNDSYIFDITGDGVNDKVDVDLTESYIQFTYVYSFYL